MQAAVPSLQETVIAGGYCVGCGACAAAEGSGLAMRWEGDMHRPFPAAETDDARAANACPFSDQSQNEDEIGAAAFGSAPRDRYIGHHLAAFAGHVTAGAFRQRGSSGGGTSWFLAEAMRTGEVDAVVHSRPDRGGKALYSYGISRSVQELAGGAKSHYYPGEISRVVAEIREAPGRYAFVGVPCVIKAVRNLMNTDPVLKERIALLVGLFCGHMKSAYFAEALGWEAGIHPEKLASVDFRVKYDDRPANYYGYAASGRGDGGESVAVTRSMRDTLVFDWGIGWFKLKACDYCDDVVSECADISFGDAWLPEYAHDARGMNVIVARSERALALLRQGSERGEIAIEPLAPDRVFESQKSGFAHRREGLAFRLWLSRRKGNWTPTKRVAPAWRHLSLSRRRVLETRVQLAEASARQFREALRTNDYSRFSAGMQNLLVRYQFWRLSNRGKLRFLATLPLRAVRKAAARIGGVGGTGSATSERLVPALRTGGANAER